MPELPEVEILARHLHRRLPGRLVRRVEVLRPRSLRSEDPGEFARKLSGARFAAVERRGKYLLFSLVESGRTFRFAGHLGMTGRICCRTGDETLPRHTAVALHLDRGVCTFLDSRGFGRMGLETAFLERLGPEPLTDDFSAGHLLGRLAASRQAIKVRLLDQALVAGLGNIHAAEALFLAGIHPSTPCRELARPEVLRLRRAVRTALRRAIRCGLSLPLDLDGPGGGERLFYFGRLPGSTQGAEERLVYGREGQPCIRCSTPVERLALGGRGSFFCPGCQPAADRRFED